MNKKPASIIITCLLLLSFIVIITYEKPVRAADGDQTVIWLFADAHMDINRSRQCTNCGGYLSQWGGNYLSRFWDAVNDTISIGVDYVISAGDDLSWRDPVGADDEIECQENWTLFNNIMASINGTYLNTSIGNHDGYFENFTTINDTGYFCHDIGNDTGGIRIIFMCDEWTKQAWEYNGVDFPPDHSGRGETYATQTAWVNSRVTEAYTTKSIFIIMHQRLEFNGLYYGAEENHVEALSGTSIESYMSNWNSAGHPYDLYAYGHTHIPCVTNESGDAMTGTYIGGQQLLVGSIAVHTSTAKYSDHPVGSRYIYLTEGSTTVTVKTYNHTGDVWVPSKEFTFELEYPWDAGQEDEEIQFIDINGGTNGTTIFNSTPTFNWTSVGNATAYQLQIATDSDFSSIVVNISDINEINYPSEYEEGTNISFTLPSAYALPTYDEYFTRVRGLTR